MNNNIRDIIDRQAGKRRENLIPVLQEVQKHFGYLPGNVIAEIGNQMQISTTKIHGVITFYNQFRYEPAGKFHIRICRGASCHMNKSALVLETLQEKLGIYAGKTDRNGLVSLEIVLCMGTCGQGPVIAVNNEFTHV